MLVFEKSYDFNSVLQNQKKLVELKQTGFQVEDESKPPKSELIEIISSPNRSWHLFKL